MDRKKEIQAELSRLREEEYKIEVSERRDENKRHVGKCYKYNNGYSKEDRWWLYIRVVEMDGDANLSVITFQKTSLNEWIYKHETFYAGNWMFEKEITIKEYEKEFSKFVGAIKK